MQIDYTMAHTTLLSLARASNNDEQHHLPGPEISFICSLYDQRIRANGCPISPRRLVNTLGIITSTVFTNIKLHLIFYTLL